MSKRVSAKSTKASVAVDAVGGSNSVPQEVQEAGKGPLPPSLHARAHLNLQSSTCPPFRRSKKTCQNSQKLSKTSPN